MAISFNQDSVWNLKPIRPEAVRKDVSAMLLEGEQIEMAFQTIRDQLVFTDRRLIAVDVQGLTGTRKTFTVMPYTRIQYFSLETPGFAEIFADSELTLFFSNGFKARFEFRGGVDLGKLGRVIARYALN